MARLQFGQQPETRCGPRALNSLVCDQKPRGFVHGYTLEGEKTDPIIASFHSNREVPQLLDGGYWMAAWVS